MKNLAVIAAGCLAVVLMGGRILGASSANSRTKGRRRTVAKSKSQSYNYEQRSVGSTGNAVKQKVSQGKKLNRKKRMAGIERVRSCRSIMNSFLM